MTERNKEKKEKTRGRRHSGFDAPAIGTIWPKGTKIRHNSDGTVTLIPPENNDEDE